MRQRVLLVYARDTGELLNRQAALGSYIFCLCELLSKEGREVFVNGIPFDSFGKHRIQSGAAGVNKKGMAGSLPGFVKKPLKFLLDLQRIKALRKQLLKSNNYDVILEFYSCASNVGSHLSSQSGKPLKMVYDSPVEEEYRIFHGKSLFFGGIMRKREKHSLEVSSGVVVYSNAVSNYLNAKYQANFAFRIHQNVDYTRFDFIAVKQSAETINIGFIGSFLKWHRVDLLVQVFDRLCHEGRNIKLFLLGKGLEFDSIATKVKEHRYRENIVMTGFVDGDELLKYKSVLHIGVMPGSNWYGAPNKIFEYGAAGMAVVAPSTPTIGDLFGSGEEVLLFEQDNPEALYERLVKYLDNDMLRVRYAQNLQKKIMETYSEKITKEFYAQLLDD